METDAPEIKIHTTMVLRYVRDTLLPFGTKRHPNMAATLRAAMKVYDWDAPDSGGIVQSHFGPGYGVVTLSATQDSSVLKDDEFVTFQWIEALCRALDVEDCVISTRLGASDRAIMVWDAPQDTLVTIHTVASVPLAEVFSMEPITTGAGLGPLLAEMFGTEPMSEPNGPRAGDIVEHSLYGVGTRLAVEGSDSTVQFLDGPVQKVPTADLSIKQSARARGVEPRIE